jgi:hypothetical protein
MWPFREVSPVTHPCGIDCRWATPVPQDSWSTWLCCSHPARGGVVRDGRECQRFESGDETGKAPSGPVPGVASASPDLSFSN